MSSRQYYDYTIRDRQTNKVLFEGSSGQCAEFLGCSRQTVAVMAERCWATEQGFFNSRYIVTRKARKTPHLKYYKVYKDGELVVKGPSKKCAKALGLTLNLWYQLVSKCSFQENPKYIITSELR